MEEGKSCKKGKITYELEQLEAGRHGLTTIRSFPTLTVK
jgi:hypothetical protein